MDLEKALAMMQQNLGAALPPVMEKIYEKDPALFANHLAGKQFAKPEGGALDERTRVLIHLAVSVALGADGCARAMAHRGRAIGLGKQEILEALYIARFAAAGKVIENAEAVIDELE